MMFVKLILICASCNSFSFKNIYNFYQDQSECVWLSDEQEISCNDPQLKRYMLIPIEEYLEFKKEWSCAKNKKLNKRSTDIDVGDFAD